MAAMQHYAAAALQAHLQSGAGPHHGGGHYGGAAAALSPADIMAVASAAVAQQSAAAAAAAAAAQQQQAAYGYYAALPSPSLGLHGPSSSHHGFGSPQGGFEQGGGGGYGDPYAHAPHSSHAGGGGSGGGGGGGQHHGGHVLPAGHHHQSTQPAHHGAYAGGGGGLYAHSPGTHHPGGQLGPPAGHHFGSGPRHAPPTLLDEFKANAKNWRLELSDAAGHLATFAADQHGSRFIQQKLDGTEIGDPAVTAAFAELAPSLGVLMTDVFGNYVRGDFFIFLGGRSQFLTHFYPQLPPPRFPQVVQKFLERGSPPQQAFIVGLFHGRVLPLSLQMYGCRVVQKALEVLPPPAQAGIVAELASTGPDTLLTCVHDQNGNHVVQKAIQHAPEQRRLLMAAFSGRGLELATHPYGCRVVQRVLEHCSREEQALMGVVRDVLGHAATLAKDQYGNYVIQHVLEHGAAEERACVVRALLGRVVELSRHKARAAVPWRI